MTRFRYRCPVRWGDMDAQGHVNNVAFLDYLQEARVEYLLSGPAEAAALLADGVLVASHQVEYLAPVVHAGPPLEVELWVDAVGGARFSLGYEVRAVDAADSRDGGSAGPTVLRARTTAVPFDLTGGGLRRLGAAERAFLEAGLDAAEPLRAVERRPVAEPAHHTPVRVRWSDLDSYGHVNNVMFAEYVQEARIALLHDTVGWRPEDVWMVARQDLEYRRPLDFRRDPYRVRTAVTAVGRRSFTLAVDVGDPDGGLAHATGLTVVVGSSPLTEGQRTALARFAAPGVLASA